MGQLKGPKFPEEMDLERWKKLLNGWMRTLAVTTSNDDIVAAIITGLNHFSTKEGVLDAVLDIEEQDLYPESAGASGLVKPEETTTTASEQPKGPPPVPVKPIQRIIPGLRMIMTTLEESFGMTEEMRVFKCYDEFEGMTREKGRSMSDYIRKFDSSYRKLVTKGIHLNDTILSYRLLKNAKLGADEKLARASVTKMTFEEMKLTLKKMEDEVVCTGSRNEFTPKVARVRVKEEPQTILFNEQDSDEEESSDEEASSDSDHEVYYNQRYQRNSSKRNEYQGKGKFKRTNKPYKSNPRKPSTCKICQSIYHWATECPHKDENARKLNRPENILKVDSVMIDDDHLLTFLAREAENIAVIDSGATKTVCGKRWFTQYMDNLNGEDRLNVMEESSPSFFRFGDGAVVKSETVQVIPTVLCGQDVLIKAHVVESDIPLLISKNTLSKAKAKLNFEDGTLEMAGIQQKLVETSSGHFAVPVGPNVENLSYSPANIEDILFMGISKEPLSAVKIAQKIHRYFAHASAEKLKTFVKGSNHENKDQICKELDNLDCEICKRHKRETPKPKTCLPLSDRFNQTVALDLKFLKTNEIVLHMIDLLTRFSAAIIIPSKSPQVILENLMQIWVNPFGRPEQVLTDNGGEFCNQDFVDLCSNIMIDVKTTAAFSPWSNGMVERHNGILADMVYKIKEDTGCSSKIALCWSVNAKNSLSTAYGFSPQQLVLGYNTSWPGLDQPNIRLNQLDQAEVSKYVAANLNAIQLSRKAFIEAQNSDRLKRAIRDRVYKAYEERYYPGDNVYYRSSNDTAWKGPGVVIGQYQKLVLVKTGGLFVRVHPSRITLCTEADKQINSNRNKNKPIERTETTEKDHHIPSNDSSSDSSSDEQAEEDHSEYINTASRNQTISSATMELSDKESEQPEELDSDKNASEGWEKVKKDAQQNRYELKEGDTIRYKESAETESFKEATVLGPAFRAASRGTTNKDRYNVQTSDGSPISIFADRLHSLEKRESQETLICVDENDMMTFFSKKPDNILMSKIETAKQSEIQNFKEFDVFEEVEPFTVEKDATVVSSRWIIQEKTDGRIKARIVARGYEEEEASMALDAPTADKTSIRIFLATVLLKGWRSGTLDVKSAFLQSHKLVRKIYLNPPKDVRNGKKVWKIKKPIYGLKDSAMNWYKTIQSDLKRLGCVQSMLDSTVFMFRVDNELKGLFLCHVDDFLFSLGDPSFTSQIIEKLKGTYIISRQDDNEQFTYVGLQMKQVPEGIAISQPGFISKIEPEPVNSIREGNDELLEGKMLTAYRRLLGKINWIAHQSRPDLSFNAYSFSLLSKGTTVKDLKQLNKFASKIQAGPQHLMLSKLKEDDLRIVCFSDASFANLPPDKTSSGEGFLTFLADSSGKCALMNWKSKKISRVVHSTISAEGLSLVDSLGDACYIRNVIEEILYNNPRKMKIPIHVYVDSNQLFKAIESTRMVTEKLLRINIAELKQTILRYENNIQLFWIPSKLMLSDSLTKSGAPNDRLIEVMDTGKLNMDEIEEHRACLKT